jgi:hypothetical protein
MGILPDEVRHKKIDTETGKSKYIEVWKYTDKKLVGKSWREYVHTILRFENDILVSWKRKD